MSPDPARPAEEAWAILAATNTATLATLTSGGGPWASVVSYALLEDGSPVLCLSHLAEHGRNLARDPRASLAIAAPLAVGRDPTDSGRVTLAGAVERPEGDELARARTAYRAAVPSAASFDEFEDFTFWVLRIERARWVGGFGRMSTVTPEELAAARQP